MVKTARSFLTEVELREGEKLLIPPPYKPDRALQFAAPDRSGFSEWLSEVLLKKLKSMPGWEESKPVAIGSWARGELSPKSDIDLLLCGEMDSCRQLVEAIHESGLKVRHRVPEDLQDWTKGVEPFDVLAILNAKPLTSEVESILEEQQFLILRRSYEFRRSLVKAMKSERKERGRRYDSVSNYLEPNIKYGPGGLRDLEQTLTLIRLFPNKFASVKKVVSQLFGYKHLLLSVRQKLHVEGFGDTLVAEGQLIVAKWMKLSSIKDFMRGLQVILAEVSFFADWVFERSLASQQRVDEFDGLRLENAEKAFALLKKDSSLQAQEVVRRQIKSIFSGSNKLSLSQRGKILRKYLNVEMSDSFVVALFRSGLLSGCISELKRVTGLVQHDQYHKYTVYAHLMQTVREVLRLYRSSKSLGGLSQVTRSFQKKDWQILLWSALYHDLAKGRSGDHSTKGSRLVKRDFTKMDMSLRLTIEVAWMVENHLVLSNAAFRRNPQSKSTWRFLHQRGVKGQRLNRLAIFTAIDIRSTNPDAWGEWKERLLYGLVQTASSSQATKFMQLLEGAEKKRIKLSRTFVSALDPALVESLPTRVLLEDYKALQNAKKHLPALVVPSDPGKFWVRFHRIHDKSGLFLSFVQLLYATGAKIQQSSVTTFDSYGVYDWFKIQSNKSLAQIKKLVEIVPLREASVGEVLFDSITLVSEEKDESVISFRGKDRKGALLVAAKSLYDHGLEVRWAHVHTWGRQIDDVFCVARPQDFLERLAKIQLKYQADSTLTQL